MKTSLYAVLGEPATAAGSVGTTRTTAVETIDDDNADAIIHATSSAAAASLSTAVTKAQETLDNDIAGTIWAIALGANAKEKPRPGPGTVITETVETIDNDTAAVTHLLLEQETEPGPKPSPNQAPPLLSPPRQLMNQTR